MISVLLASVAEVGTGEVIHQLLDGRIPREHQMPLLEAALVSFIDMNHELVLL